MSHMPPRGLRKLLKDSQPSKLVGGHGRKRFELAARGERSGVVLRGLTKRLQTRIFSSGTLPAISIHSDAPAGGHWRGAGGGRRRGTAVDSQVSRLAGVGSATRRKANMLRLTKIVFAALDERGLEPVLGQRCVASASHRIGTAADVVCYDSNTSELVLVELKCGHAHGRTAAALDKGEVCKMRAPVAGANDCVLHRHLAQLAVTTALFMREARTLARLGALGIENVTSMLVYANDDRADVYTMPKWWRAKGEKILNALK